MWTRKELKQKGKKAFNANYWKCVLVALIMAIIVGGSSGNAGGGAFHRSPENVARATTVGATTGIASDSEGSADIQDNDGPAELIDQMTDELRNNEDTAKAIAFIGVSAGLAIILVIAFVIAIDILLFNPLEVGCSRFFYRNLDEQAKVAEVTYAFDHEYKNTISTMFYRDLYILLWSLLFIIPGIVKAYEYRMIPYLLAEDPGLSKDEAFAKSKAMMTGQKWKAFVLDLSFIGWDILSAFTVGLLGLFYVNPYKRATQAALYEALVLQGENNEV